MTRGPQVSGPGPDPGPVAPDVAPGDGPTGTPVAPADLEARLETAAAALDEALACTARGRPTEVLAVAAPALADLADLLGAGPDPAALLLQARLLLTTAGARFDLDGDRTASVAQLEAALESAQRAGADEVVVAVHGQRAYVAMRAGDAQTATEEYDEAVALIDAAEPRDACILLLNRGYLHLDGGRLDQARADFEDCVARARAGDLPRLVHRASHNLAYAEFLAGDLPRALAMFDAAEELLVRDGTDDDEPVVMLDRAQVLVEAGLLTEADAQLRGARASFEERGFAHDRAEVDLLRARTALLLDDPAAGLSLARAARGTFAQRENAVWRVRADLVVHQALVALHETRATERSRSLVALGSRAEALADRAGALDVWAGVQVCADARVLAAQAYAQGGDLVRARRVLEDVGELPGRDSLPRQVHLALVRAQVAFATGQRAQGRSRVAAGRELLGAHRAQFGSVDAVTASSIHGLRLIELDLADALASGDPALVLGAVEQGRVAFAGPAGVRPDADRAVAEATSRLRQLSERTRLLPPDAEPAELAALREEAAGLRSQVRALGWRRGDGQGPPAAVTMEVVRSHVVEHEGATVVDFVSQRGVLYAVLVDPLGDRLEVVGAVADVDEQVRRVRSDLRTVANTLIPEPLRTSATQSLRSGLRRLDAALLAGVRLAGPLHVVAPGFLLALPWQELPSRRGLPTSAGSHLIDPAPGHHAPDLASAPALGQEGARTRVAAVAGPGVALADLEARTMAGLWPGASLLTGDAATTGALTAALGDNDVVHLAAHGTHVVQNPLFSSVLLADGPLFAYELEGMRLSPGVVVLSACEVGQVTPTPGGQVLGLGSVLLRLGVQTVIAAVAPVDDAVAHRAMSHLHERLRAGGTPQAALASAAAASPVPLPFVCFASSLGKA